MDFGVNYQGYSGFEWTYINTGYNTYYIVSLNVMAVSGQSLDGNPADFGTTIVDSGTTLIILPPKLYSAFVANLYESCSTSHLVGICQNVTNNKTLFDGACYSMSQSELDAFPTLSFTFDGTTPLNVPPQGYLYSLNGTYCMGIQNSGNTTKGTILGDIFIQNFHTVFDLVQAEVGFGPLTSCPTATTTISNKYRYL